MIKYFINKLNSTKFHMDVLWNIGSLGLIGISGILLNIIISNFYNASILGVFNQVYAAYIFFSQFAVGGIHFSTLKYVSEFSEDKNTSSIIIFSALIITIFLAFVFSSIFYFCSEFVGKFLESDDVAKGIEWVSVGLFFFAINKVLLFILNAYRKMRIFAICQSLRYIFIILSLVVIIILKLPGEMISVIFSTGEFLLFIILIILVKKHFSFVLSNKVLDWIKKHFKFGIKSFFSGVLIELNTRIDVLMLGYFLSDRMVGIYSFAAIIAEGISQLPIVIRTNFNPILVKNIVAKNFVKLNKLVKKVKLYTYLIMFIICGIAVILYPIGIKLITNKVIYYDSWDPFSILVIGIFLSSGFIPLNQILLQAGKPGLHTLMISSVIIFNVVINYLLIPILGISGAAMATSMAFVFSVIILYIITYKILKVKL